MIIIIVLTRPPLPHSHSDKGLQLIICHFVDMYVLVYIFELSWKLLS